MKRVSLILPSVKSLPENRFAWGWDYFVKMEVRTDKRGHKYCYEKGKGRVPCPEDQTNATTPTTPAAPTPGPGRPIGVPDANTGGDHGGGTGGNDGGGGSQPTGGKPRILTIRPELTKPGNPNLVPKSIRQHLNEHQIQGVSLSIEAMSKYGGMLIADGTGVGKTREILGISQYFLEQGKKVVVVSPAEVLKQDWKKKTIAGSFADDSAAMGVPVQLIKGDEKLTTGKVQLTTYEELVRLKGQVDKDTIVLFDESHYMKNRSSARHKHGKEIMEKAGAVLYATATPADQPLHIAHLVRANVFGNVGAKETYEKLGMVLKNQRIHGGATIKVWAVDKSLGYNGVARRIAGLFDQMTKDGLMIKREMTMDRVAIQMDHVDLGVDQIKEMEDLYEKRMAETNDNVAVSLMAVRLHQEPMKIPATVKMVQEELAAGRMPVVFAGRVNDITDEDEEGNAFVRSEGTLKALKAALIAAGVPEKDIGELHGGATKTPRQKKQAMDDFQAGKTKIMLATIQSGGTGVNLDDTTGKRPRSMVIMTPPFMANDMAQAIGRINRMNTKSDVRIRGVLSNSNTDRWNASILEKKFKTLGAVVGGSTTRGMEAIGLPAEEDDTPIPWGESLIPTPKVRFHTPYAHRDIIRQYGGRPVKTDTGWVTEFPSQAALDKYQAAVAAPPKAPTAPPPPIVKPPTPGAKLPTPAVAPSPAGAATPAPPVAKPTPYISPDQKQAIHQALRFLAAADSDRARVINGEGFNKMDGEFGASLAGQATLSDRQAAAAARMLAKYRRQLDSHSPGLTDRVTKFSAAPATPPPPVVPPTPVAPAPTPVTPTSAATQEEGEYDELTGEWKPAAPKPAAPVAPTPAPVIPKPAVVSTPATPPPTQKLPPVQTRQVNTSNGPRHVHAFPPSQGFWRVWKSPNRPKWVSARKNPSSGQWEASIWGANQQEVQQHAEELNQLGGLKYLWGHYIKSLRLKYRR